MEKNKSIDGLATRRPRTTKSSHAVVHTTRKTTKKPAARPATKRAIAKRTTTKVVKTTRSSAQAVRSSSAAKARTTKTRVAKPRVVRTKTTRTAKPVASPSTQPTPQFSDITPVQPTSQQPQEQTPEQLQNTTPKTPSEINESFLNPTHVFEFDEQSGELKASADQTNPKEQTKKMKKEKKAKKPVSKKRKIITSIILVIVLLLIGGVIWLILWGNDIIAKITGGQGNVFDLVKFVEPTYDPLKTDANGRTNILAFGTSGYNMEGDEGDGTHDGAQLTDSIMAISLNQETGDVAMISLPRDLKASPTCTATGKINEVYWCNGGKGDATIEEEATAAQALMDEVGSILGMDFQYFAHLNWGSLISIVDTLGGINVTLDEDISDYGWTGAVYEAGVQYTLDGEAALGLARARHGTAGGDFSRGASQQKILVGIKDKIFEKQLSLTDILGLASTLGDNLRTNFSVDELKSFAHLASEFDFNAMRQISLYPDYMTTGSINGISYVLPRGGAGYYTAIQDFVATMLSNDPRVYENATILVLNGTETPYLASNEQTKLEEAGYKNITADNAPAGTYPDKIAIYDITNTTPGTKKMLEEQYQTQAKPADELPEGISKDYNFVIILGGENHKEE